MPRKIGNTKPPDGAAFFVYRPTWCVNSKKKRRHIMKKIKGRRIFAFESTRASTIYGIRHLYITYTLTKDKFENFLIVLEKTRSDKTVWSLLNRKCGLTKGRNSRVKWAKDILLSIQTELKKFNSA